MSFEYPVIESEEEALKAREFQLLEDGTYRFRVVESKFVYSQAGNPMIKLKLMINHQGKDCGVFDNLIGTSNMTWKTKHFCEAVGLSREYLSGLFNESMALHKEGLCLLKFVEAKPNPNKPGEMYKPKNEVEDYVGDTAQKKNNAFGGFKQPEVKQPVNPNAIPFEDSDLPF